MATGAELLAADMLALALEKEALLLGNRLMRSFGKLEPEAYTQRILEGKLKGEIQASVGKLWIPQIRFLKISTGATEEDPLKLSPVRWAEVHDRNRVMVEKMLKVKNLQPLADAGSVLNDVITRQVDETQQYEGARKGIQWVRHTDAGACSWCRDQVAAYASTRSWFRHANCKCFKVRGEGN